MTNRGSPLGAIRDAYEHRLREAEALRDQARAVADRAYQDAVRAGRGVATRVHKHAERLGADISRSLTPPRKPGALTSSRLPARPAARSPAKSRGDVIVDQILAAARGGQDGLTLGLGDFAYASGGALLDAARGQDFREALARRREVERRRDAYDAQHYGVARTVGKIGGTVLGAAALGPVDAALAGGLRIAQTTAIGGRELAALGGVGAGLGVLGQGVVDLRRGRLGSPGDYGGAAISGATATLAATLGRPAQASALGGATTAIYQDIYNHRPVDLDAAREAALVGGYLGGVAGLAGRAASNSLPRAAKGDLGEAMGVARSWANLEWPVEFEERFELRTLPKTKRGKFRHTRVDHKTNSGLRTEQKFGDSDLSKNQKEALRVLKNRYRVDHFLPRDVGVMAGLPAGMAGSRVVLDDQKR